MNSVPNVRKPVNEPVLSYAPGSKERTEIKAALQRAKSQTIEIPLIIGGKEIRTGRLAQSVMPHDHGHVLANYHLAGPAEVQMAIDAAMAAKKDWENTPWQHRAAVLLKAAELLAGPWRQTLNAATMLGQSKTVFQAEIDSACELIDFFRFNAHFAQEIYTEQPNSIADAWNRLEWRPLEGFTFAVTPFNFTAIAGNLPTSPALLGNTVVWKPASSAMYSGYMLMKLFEAAGLPAGVINFLPGPGRILGDIVLPNEHLAGVHFTGSTGAFQGMWKTVGMNIHNYHTYPRLIGETGGKDFVVAHPSADVRALVTALVRGSFEYQGQKCSAASRAYIPKSIWPAVKEGLLAQMDAIKIGCVEDFRNFMGAVIDKPAYTQIKEYIDFAKASPEAEVFGGKCSDEFGYFVWPTVIVTTNPKFKTIQEEIFGPVLTVYVYNDADFTNVLTLCDQTSPYALTGSIFATERPAIVAAENALRHSAGNFYINDKPTGAVVGQQPFGGARASGTNDKAGSKSNLLRWTSPRTIKETFAPPTDFRYPFMQEE